MNTFATEEVQRRKCAVFADLARDPLYKTMQDLMRDRTRSSDLRLHEDKHVHGKEGTGHVCFQDAAVHLGVAAAAHLYGGENLHKAFGDLKSLGKPTLKKENDRYIYTYAISPTRSLVVVQSIAKVNGRAGIISVHVSSTPKYNKDDPAYMVPMEVAEAARNFVKTRVMDEEYEELLRSK